MVMKDLLLLVVTISSVTGAFNITNSEKKGKVFSLFTIVQFPNSVCTTISATYTKGTCLASSECSARGGSASGNCAAGFGVCCTFYTSTCGSSISQNCSYVVNPGYPTVYSTAAACAITVKKCSDDVCQLRLDFEAMVLSVSANTRGGCGDQITDADSFAATGQTSINPPVICGINTGQHMYLEMGTLAADTATLTFITSAATAITNRSWRIKVTQISCTSTERAPNHCVQYHTGVTGNVQTYGFQSAQMLGSQAYTNCIRQEEGYCSVTYTQSLTTAPDPFDLGNADAANEAKNPINAATAGGLGNACIGAPSSYITIKGGSFTPGGTLNTGNQFCGENLSGDTITEAEAPGGLALTSSSFELGVFSDEATKEINGGGTGQTGINLDYQQNLCS